jgi:hypothetical protein
MAKAARADAFALQENQVFATDRVVIHGHVDETELKAIVTILAIARARHDHARADSQHIALAQALLTRNAVLLKLSSEDSGFTELFTQTLLDADDDGVLRSSIAVCSWSSTQEACNQIVRAEADAVVVWGGQSVIDAYPAERCRGRVILYGPRLGIWRFRCARR